MMLLLQEKAVHLAPKKSLRSLLFIFFYALKNAVLVSIDTLKQTVNLDARMINFLQTDSGFDGIRNRL